VAEFGVERGGTGEYDVDAGQVVVVDHRVFGERDSHRRSDVDAIDPVLRDDAKEFRQVEFRHSDHGALLVQALVHHHGHAVDVEERQHGQDRGLRGDLSHALDLQQVRNQIAMCEYHALGAPGGTRRVGQHCGVLRAHRLRRRLRRAPQQVAQRGIAVHLRVQQDDRLRRQPGLGGRRCGPVEERRDREQQLGAGVDELVRELARRVERVGAGDDRVGAQHTVEHRGVERSVRGEQAHHITRADAALRERRGDLQDHPLQLGEGDGHSGPAVHQRRPISLFAEVTEKEVEEGDLGDLDIRVRATDGHFGLLCENRTADNTKRRRSDDANSESNARSRASRPKHPNGVTRKCCSGHESLTS
jgi:hypothetical protein